MEFTKGFSFLKFLPRINNFTSAATLLKNRISMNADAADTRILNDGAVRGRVMRILGLMCHLGKFMLPFITGALAIASFVLKLLTLDFVFYLVVSQWSLYDWVVLLLFMNSVGSIENVNAAQSTALLEALVKDSEQNVDEFKRLFPEEPTEEPKGASSGELWLAHELRQKGVFMISDPTVRIYNGTLAV